MIITTEYTLTNESENLSYDDLLFIFLKNKSLHYNSTNSFIVQLQKIKLIHNFLLTQSKNNIVNIYELYRQFNNRLNFLTKKYINNSYITRYTINISFNKFIKTVDKNILIRILEVCDTINVVFYKIEDLFNIEDTNFYEVFKFFICRLESDNIFKYITEYDYRFMIKEDQHGNYI